MLPYTETMKMTLNSHTTINQHNTVRLLKQTVLCPVVVDDYTVNKTKLSLDVLLSIAQYRGILWSHYQYACNPTEGAGSEPAPPRFPVLNFSQSANECLFMLNTLYLSSFRWRDWACWSTSVTKLHCKADIMDWPNRPAKTQKLEIRAHGLKYVQRYSLLLAKPYNTFVRSVIDMCH